MEEQLYCAVRRRSKKAGVSITSPFITQKLLHKKEPENQGKEPRKSRKGAQNIKEKGPENQGKQPENREKQPENREEEPRKSRNNFLCEALI